MPRSSSSQDFKNFVERYLIVQDAKDYRHCQSPAKFVALKADRPGVIGGYFCPENYSTRIVYFSLDPDREWFLKILQDQADGLVRPRDIRVATRHGWELGGNAEKEIKLVSDNGIKQLYWTLYPASDEEKTTGPFLCANCGKLFVKHFSEPSKLCSNCG